MTELNLDDLLAAKRQSHETPADPPPAIPEAAWQFTPEEQKKISAIKETIDPMNTQTSLQYGMEAQKNIADFSDSMLTTIRSKDSGYVGELLQDLVAKVKYLDGDTAGFLQKIPFLNTLVSAAQHTAASYEKVSAQVEKIQGELDKARMAMLKDIVMLDNLYEKNLQYFKALQLYIAAGEEKLHELQTLTIPKLHAQAAASQDPMASQVVHDFENAVNRFEKKLHDLKISRTMAIQTAPQIRLIQNNNKLLVEKIQGAIYNTIPLWKSQIVIALGLSRQQQVLTMQRNLANATNDLLQKNAELLRQNSIQTAAETERSIVDTETLKKVNENLIATIEETITIQQEGRAKRQAAEQELAQIEAQVRQILLAPQKNSF